MLVDGLSVGPVFDGRKIRDRLEETTSRAYHRRLMCNIAIGSVTLLTPSRGSLRNMVARRGSESIRGPCSYRKISTCGPISVTSCWISAGRGKPTDNAFAESFNGRVRAECLNANWFLSLADARFKCEAWRRDYNEVRPHNSLGSQTPMERAFASGQACLP